MNGNISLSMGLSRSESIRDWRKYCVRLRRLILISLLLTKSKWIGFIQLLNLENGVPSHDTFDNVFAVIDTQKLNHAFSRWIADLTQLTAGKIIAIDGKCLGKRLNWASGKAAIYGVSA